MKVEEFRGVCPGVSLRVACPMGVCQALPCSLLNEQLEHNLNFRMFFFFSFLFFFFWIDTEEGVEFPERFDVQLIRH